VTAIVAAVDDPGTTTVDLARVLERDPAFAADLLRHAGSPARAHPIQARTVRQAVMLVDRRALRELALEAAVSRVLGGGAPRGQLQEDAVSVAALALAAAGRLALGSAAPHLAALLHDVGLLVLPLAFGVEACDAIGREHPCGPERVLAERERLGVDHALAGALLAERWELPAGVVEAIALHHGGPSGVAAPTEPVAVVQLAGELRRVLTGGAPDHALLEVALERCGADAAVLDELARHARPAAAAPTEAGALGRRLTDVDGLSQTDDRTGAANRRHWLQSTRAALAHLGDGAVVLCELAGLDRVRELDGLGVADAALGEVARVLGDHGRVGRLGGDRFAVWAAGAGRPAAEIAGAVGAELADALGVGAVSVGWAAAPRDGHDLAALLDAAAARLAAAPDRRRAPRSLRSLPGGRRGGSRRLSAVEAARLARQPGPRVVPARPFAP
jgi:HD-like signal output (HDOD) protein/GGDEF domain-containing protein